MTKQPTHTLSVADLGKLANWCQDEYGWSDGRMAKMKWTEAAVEAVLEERLRQLGPANPLIRDMTSRPVGDVLADGYVLDVNEANRKAFTREQNNHRWADGVTQDAETNRYLNVTKDKTDSTGANTTHSGGESFTDGGPINLMSALEHLRSLSDEDLERIMAECVRMAKQLRGIQPANAEAWQTIGQIVDAELARRELIKDSVCLARDLTSLSNFALDRDDQATAEALAGHAETVAEAGRALVVSPGMESAEKLTEAVIAAQTEVVRSLQAQLEAAAAVSGVG